MDWILTSESLPAQKPITWVLFAPAGYSTEYSDQFTRVNGFVCVLYACLIFHPQAAALPRFTVFCTKIQSKVGQNHHWPWFSHSLSLFLAFSLSFSQHLSVLIKWNLRLSGEEMLRWQCDTDKITDRMIKGTFWNRISWTLWWPRKQVGKWEQLDRVQKEFL